MPTELRMECPYMRAVNHKTFKTNVISLKRKTATGKHQHKKNRIPSPSVTGVIPVKQLIAVVFPAPFGPRRQKS